MGLLSAVRNLAPKMMRNLTPFEILWNLMLSLLYGKPYRLTTSIEFEIMFLGLRIGAQIVCNCSL